MNGLIIYDCRGIWTYSTFSNVLQQVFNLQIYACINRRVGGLSMNYVLYLNDDFSLLFINVRVINECSFFYVSFFLKKKCLISTWRWGNSGWFCSLIFSMLVLFIVDASNDSIIQQESWDFVIWIHFQFKKDRDWYYFHILLLQNHKSCGELLNFSIFFISLHPKFSI